MCCSGHPSTRSGSSRCKPKCEWLDHIAGLDEAEAKLIQQEEADQEMLRQAPGGGRAGFSGEASRELHLSAASSGLPRSFGRQMVSTNEVTRASSAMIALRSVWVA